MSLPFDPPAVPKDDPGTVMRERRVTQRATLVVGAWGLATTAVGTAIGVTLQILGSPNASAVFGVGGLVMGLAAGVGVLVLERTQARGRPALVGARGLDERPLHGAVLGLPIVLALPAVLWLVVVGSLAVQSLVPAGLFGLGALALAFAGLQVLAQHRLARALESLDEAPSEEAMLRLTTLAKSPLTPRAARRTAQLAVAMTRLQEGRGLEALGWFEGIEDGEAAAWAATGRAMASLLLAQAPSDAEAHLQAAFDSDHANAVRAQADAVRVLVVWRRDGPDAARRLAEQLHGTDATPLHLALLARLRAITGDEDGAFALDTPAIRALVASGLGRAIPELHPPAPSSSR